MESSDSPSVAAYGQPTLDDETLARAVLTYCINGADALMFATIKGAGSAISALRLIADASRAGSTGSMQKLDQVFATGTAQWGRKVSVRGMNAFHNSLHRWQSRLKDMPTHNASSLADWLTAGGRQWIIVPTSPFWPHQLEDLSTRKEWATPLCLWGKGNASALTSCSRPVAVVGSRGVNDYGRYVARNVAEHAAEAGHLVVSGGAYGADAAAHWGALESMSRLGRENSGRTIAVFAGGLNHIGPERNSELFRRILASGGALISELSPDTIPEARRFLLRNRIIAALASTVVVAQARNRSGALNTANWAADLGREVYAAPGDINTPGNTGCNHLIGENRAMLLNSVNAIDEICHAAHPPIVVDDTRHTDAKQEHTAPDSRPQGNAGPATRTSTSDPATRTETAAESDVTERQHMVMTAIRQCRRRKLSASYDTLLSMLGRENSASTRRTPCKTKPDPTAEPAAARQPTPPMSEHGSAPVPPGNTVSPWTVASLGEELGEMELLGLVQERNGVFSLATGSAADRPASHPRRRSHAPSEGQ